MINRVFKTQLLLKTNGIDILLIIFDRIVELRGYVTDAIAEECGTYEHPHQIHGCFHRGGFVDDAKT